MLATVVNQLGKFNQQLDFVDQERLWTLSYLEGQEPSLLVIVDDRLQRIIGVVAKRLPPTAFEMEPIGPPNFQRIEPNEGQQGEILTIHGDNFLTLAGQTIVRVDGRPVAALRLTMNTIAIKVPGWAVRGDVQVVTPLGTTGETGHGAFVPLPRFESFEPKRGTYNALRQRGSLFSVFGDNFRAGCKIRFASGLESPHVEILSPGRMHVEVPEHAGSGPLTLVYEDHEQSLSEIFMILPRVDQVVPRQARVGDLVSLLGNSLAHVTDLAVGRETVLREDFELQTPNQIVFRIPPSASDGAIRIREQLASGLVNEVTTRDMFYIVPKITGFAQQVIMPGRLLTIFGDGLDPDADMMTLLFEGRGGLSEAPVLSVSIHRGSLTTRVPDDAVTGYVLLLRKRVYSGISAADTSDMSANKLTVLTIDGDPSDLIF